MAWRLSSSLNQYVGRPSQFSTHGKIVFLLSCACRDDAAAVIASARKGAGYRVTGCCTRIALTSLGLRQALVEDASMVKVNGRTLLHPMQFAEDVLGFEDYSQAGSITAQ